MKYFTEDELKCTHCGKGGMDADFMVKIETLREQLGFPFPVNSAYRCPEHPIEARKERLGAHTYGKAVDILANGENALEIIRVAQKHGIKRIGVQQKGGGRFIHLDVCTEEEGFPPAIWSY